MKQDLNNLSFLYENLLINEISKDIVKNVKDAISEKDLPFQNIFGDKLRIVVPVSGTEIYNEILNDVSKIKDYAGFDPYKKEVTRKITLDPKYGKGTKEQKINLGKVINALKIDPEKKKKYLNWFANYESNIPEMEDLKRYSIVVSRSPVDVLRMSDVGSIRSCHSQGGSYFSCAIQEAKTGGAVAYVVKTQDLKKLSEDELQNEEIFSDSQRNIKGIDAISRLRIRRYKLESEQPTEIGLPESRTYGAKIPGFYDTVKQFLSNAQNFEKEKIYDEYRKKKIVRTGGSYTDSSDSSLFNAMFDTNMFHGSTPHEDNDEVEARADQFEQELRDFQNRFEFEHVNASYNVDEYDDQEVYYTAWGQLEVDISPYQVVDEFIEIDDEYIIDSLKRYSETQEYKPYLPPDFREKTTLYTYKNFLNDFKKYDKSYLNDSDLLNRIFIKSNYDNDTGERTENRSILQLGVEFNPDGETSFNTDDYWEYLRILENIDNDYDQIRKSLIKALLNNNLIKSTDSTKDLSDQKPMQNAEEFIENLKNFDYDESDDEATTHLYIGKFEIPNIHNMNISTDATSMRFGEAFEKYLDLYYKPKQKTNPNQLTFDKFFENYKTATLKDKYDISKIKASYTTEWGHEQYYNMKLTITFESLTNKTAELLKFIDDHYYDITNIARLLFFRVQKTDNEDIRKLQQVYAKVL